MANSSVSWSEGKLRPLTLVLGSEDYLASRAIRQLRELAKTEHEQLEIIDHQDPYSPGLLLSLATPSLFSEPKFLVLNQIGDGILEDLEQLEMNFPDQTYLVIRVGSLVGVGGKLKTKLSATAQLIQCDEVKRDSDRAEFVRSEFTNAGQRISPDAVRALTNAFNEDLSELGGACAQLIAAGFPNISIDLVEQMFAGRVETNAFRIADAALSGNAPEAVRLLRHGLATGIDQVALTAALAMRVRQLAKLFNNRSANPATLGMQPWQLEKARKELAGWDEPDLVALVQQLAKTDADVKGASKDPAFSLELLLLKMANKGK